jgi:dihydrofolate reductase
MTGPNGEKWSGSWKFTAVNPISSFEAEVWGSSTLTSTLLEHGLGDEVLMIVYLVLLGTGKRFFCGGHSGTVIRARQHESHAVRQHSQRLRSSGL